MSFRWVVRYRPLEMEGVAASSVTLILSNWRWRHYFPEWHGCCNPQPPTPSIDILGYVNNSPAILIWHSDIRYSYIHISTRIDSKFSRRFHSQTIRKKVSIGNLLSELVKFSSRKDLNFSTAFLTHPCSFSRSHCFLNKFINADQIYMYLLYNNIF